MEHRTLKLLVLGVGIALLAPSLLADVIGIGDGAGMGPWQTTGSVVGALIAIVGVVLLLRSGTD